MDFFANKVEQLEAELKVAKAEYRKEIDLAFEESTGFKLLKPMLTEKEYQNFYFSYIDEIARHGEEIEDSLEKMVKKFYKANGVTDKKYIREEVSLNKKILNCIKDNIQDRDVLKEDLYPNMNKLFSRVSFSVFDGKYNELQVKEVLEEFYYFFEDVLKELQPWA